MNIILLGPPGAGKGTQSQRLVAERDMIQLSTGDMLRAARSSGTAMGKRVAAVMDAGNLVTDEIVIGLIDEQLSSPELDGKGVIFDGFPRTLPQADALGALLASKGLKLAHVIEMRVDDDVLVGRITGRFTCDNCGAVYHDETKPPAKHNVCDECGAVEKFSRRKDDNENSLRTRLLAYYRDTSPLIGYYYAKGLLARVDGLGSIAEVSGEIDGILNS
ncbi:MAG: adenylate kinase [Paracoccaceae bacterium]